jgi:RNA polymerase sigma factor (sigma-70 family)
MSETVVDLAALKRGDEVAWNGAFRSLYRYAYRAALTPRAQLSLEEAEDVAIDALTKLVPLVTNVANEGQLHALVVTIAQRQAISLARRRSALKRPRPSVSLDALAERQEPEIDPDGAESPTGLVESAELLTLLHQLLARLEPVTRQLLVAHHLEGSTFAELSQRFGLPPGTVSVKIARGVQQVRAGLGRSAKLLKELGDYLR